MYFRSKKTLVHCLRISKPSSKVSFHSYLDCHKLRRFPGASEGVVLFTMGFIFDSTAVPKSMIRNLFAAFERLPQKVIFKYDMQEGKEYSAKFSPLPPSPGEVSGQSGVRVPSNVLVLPWVPQQAILAHKATKVFITHCGMHGVLEAIYHQVKKPGSEVKNN